MQDSFGPLDLDLRTTKELCGREEVSVEQWLLRESVRCGKVLNVQCLLKQGVRNAAKGFQMCSPPYCRKKRFDMNRRLAEIETMLTEKGAPNGIVSEA